MNIRKEIRALTASEQLLFINTLLEMKRTGVYDKYVHWHHAVMVPTVHSYEPQDPTYRNGAHRGPAFLPWHREMLLQFEGDLQAINPAVTLPYWNWTLDAAAPEQSPLWSQGFLGGDGDPADQYRVQDGAFADKYGNWPVDSLPEDGLPGPGLKRQFGTMVSSLPTGDDLRMALSESLYDEPPYSSSPFVRGFRNRFEGWITQRGDPNVKTPGSQLHNRVHLWIGGNMAPMTSPNDPAFFLHHCFIDKIWADWQAQRMLDAPDLAPHYCPMRDGPPSHNYEDVLKPWARRIVDVIDIKKLGYSYEPEQGATKSPLKSPFTE